MAGKSAALSVKILGDASGAKRGFADAERAGDRMGRKMAGIGKLAAGGILAVGAAALSIGKQAFDAAAALEQSAGAVESVFGRQSKAVKKAASEAADAVGLSANSYNELAAVIGSQLKNAGTPTDQLAKKTDNLVTMGADLAATFGGTTADAVGALSSLMRGETDPIERYGVSIKQADIAAQMAAAGTDKLTGAQGKAARQAALMTLLTQQTSAAQGQAAREADTAAGAQQRLAAKFDNVMASLGEKLLPLFVTAVEFIEQKIMPAVESLIGGNGQLGDTFAQVGAFISEQLVPAFAAVWRFIQKYVVPILRSVLGPAIQGIRSAFAAVTDALARNRSKFEPLLNFLRDKVAPFVGKVLGKYFENFGTVLGTVTDAVGWLAEKLAWLLDKGAGAIEWAKGLFGGGNTRVDVVASQAAGRPQLAGAAAGITAPLRGAAMSGTSAGGFAPAAGGGSTQVVNITVNGALDPMAVGRQVRRMLDDLDRTTGRRVALTVGARA